MVVFRLDLGDEVRLLLIVLEQIKSLAAFPVFGIGIIRVLFVLGVAIFLHEEQGTEHLVEKRTVGGGLHYDPEEVSH